MTDTHAILAVAIAAAVTIALRALPFIIFGRGKDTPALLTYLGKVLPCAIMGMLVVFCLKRTKFSSLAGFLPALIASIVVIVLHAWKRNTLLSIILGTAVYMFLVQSHIF